MPITLAQVEEARRNIAGTALRTPVVRLNAGPDVYLKLENLQPIGSFKLRGAYNKIASLNDAERARGVITYSSGNHAQGVAYAARAVGAKATGVIPRTAPAIKADATRRLGAEIEFVGPASSERQQRAEQLAAERGLCVVPPYDDLQIIAGQGTAALELMNEVPGLDTLITCVGGGGLLSGSLVAANALVPQGMVVPPRSLVTGVPARVRRDLSDAEIAANRHNAEVYRRLLDLHRAAFD